MNILILLLQMPDDENSSNLYTDLIDEFHNHGHTITVIAPSNNGKTYLNQERGWEVLRVKTYKTQGVKSMIKKGIALAMLPSFFKKAYNKHLSEKKYDWIFMSTPPITLIDFVSYLKNKTQAKFYLILRDIHPQSAASIGLIKYKFMYSYLEKRASKGYEISDLIGCMSNGNMDYISSNYPELNSDKLVLLYNWQKYEEYEQPKVDIRKKYKLGDKVIVVFGGTIGLGQRVENIYSLISNYHKNENVVFCIIGKGVAKDWLQKQAVGNNLDNVIFIDFMPRVEYLDLIKSADIGLISINENYAVPTCPSKAVGYMSLKIPIFAMINPNNDYGQIIENAGAGSWVVGNEKAKGYKEFDEIINDEILRRDMGDKGYSFYKSNLTSLCAYNTIIDQIENEKA